MKILPYIFFTSFFFFGCLTKPNSAQTVETKTDTIIKPEIKELITAAEDTASYLKLLRNKNAALVANQTSVAFGRHLLDFLIENGIKIEKIFAPEHGFRGEGEAGEKISSSTDKKTGVKIVSLFGANKKPTSEQMKNIETVIYDIQDVGCRFFTYISTMHKVMESCAENNVEIIVLDRPNPNIDYVDGPIREENCVSFVSLDPLPVVYGMTAGELAQMINGEGWLSGGKKCKLTVIPVKNYDRKTKYIPPVKPSPNLPDYLSIRLYPSLCLFEGTDISVGRGTTTPFSSIGYPDEKYGEYVFTPEDIPGMQTNPMHKGKKCFGINFKEENPDNQHFTLDYFIKMYNISGGKMVTRKRMLDLLYGNTRLVQQLSKGMTEEEIRRTWEPQLSEFKKNREKYLIYN
jgi:uncharacterized protein YbbC (DUF1343 family)